jgi:putative MATE family efflux protein
LASRDLTVGPVRGHLVALAIPVIVSTTLQSVYALLNLGWAGLLGDNAVAALSITFQVFFVVLGISQMLGATAQADISQDWGAGRRDQASRTFSTYLVAGALVGVVAASVSFAMAGPYVTLLNDDPAVHDVAVAYFRVHSVVFLTQLLLLLGAVGFRSSGDFRTPVQNVVLSLIVNFTLDPLLMFGGAGWPEGSRMGPVFHAVLSWVGLGDWPGLGLVGAAWATVVAQLVALSLYAVVLLRPRGEGLRLAWPQPSMAFVTQILTRGVPAGTQFLLLWVVLGLVFYAVKPHGSQWTAVAGGGFRVLQQGFLPVVALGSAAAALTGQNAGAGKIDRIAETVRTALLWSLVYGLLFSVTLAFAGRTAGRLFISDASLDAAEIYFWWSAPVGLFFGLAMIPTALLQSLKRPWWSLVGAAIRIALLTALVFGLIVPLGLHPRWAFAAATITALIESLWDTGWLFQVVRGLNRQRLPSPS